MTLLIGHTSAGQEHKPRDMNWYVRIGFAGSVIFLGTGIAWATLAPLEGAVVASGNVVVENNINKLQHPTGGVIGAILVKEGQRVKEGDVVLRLDETSTKANLQIVKNEMISVRARLARLQAERDGSSSVTVPPDMAAQVPTSPDVVQAFASEALLFMARQKTRRGQRDQFEEQIKQAKQEIEGTAAQYKSSEQQLEVADLELKDMRMLYTRNLVPRTRLTTLEREVARIRGSLGEYTAKTAQSRAKIAEIELQILQINQTLQSEVARELRENEAKLGELVERFTTAEDQLRRVELRAPKEGMVHQLQNHTVGGVIAPGAVIMNIVPERETLVVEAKANPNDIDQLYVDQPARVRFAAFNTRTTPELQGHVFRVAADLTRDERTGASYYLVGVRIQEAELAKLGKLKLVPGMPAESFIKTTERTLASFLFRPLLDHMNRAFREK